MYTSISVVNCEAIWMVLSLYPVKREIFPYATISTPDLKLIQSPNAFQELYARANGIIQAQFEEYVGTRDLQKNC